MNLPDCKCGCGAKVTHPSNIYLQGHYARGRKKSATHRSNIGKANSRRIWTDESRQKLSNTRIEKFSSGDWDYLLDMLRAPREAMSTETKQLMSESRNKFLDSEQGKLLCKEYRKRFSGPGNPFYGRTHTDEVKELLSYLAAGRTFCTKDTKIELLTRQYLLDKDITYRTNLPIKTSSYKSYNVDILVNNVCIECDGCYWHACLDCFPDLDFVLSDSVESVRTCDTRKNSALIQDGYKVVRLWEHEILSNDFSKLDFLL